MARVTVRLRYLRSAPRKVRLITDLIRGAIAQAALTQLAVVPKRAAQPVRKLLVAGLAAARDKGLKDTDIWIEAVRTDQGPALKRRRLNSRGRASQVKKFTTHITLTLSDNEKVQAAKNPKRPNRPGGRQVRNKVKNPKSEHNQRV